MIASTFIFELHLEMYVLIFRTEKAPNPSPLIAHFKEPKGCSVSFSLNGICFLSLGS